MDIPTISQHLKVHKMGRDKIPDKIIGPGYKVPSVHRELASTGLSKLINTGHHRSLRVDINGLMLSKPDEEAEDVFFEALEKRFSVETVMVLQRETTCSILFDFTDISKVYTEETKKEFLKEVQRIGFSMAGKPGDRSFHGSPESNWESPHAIHRPGPSYYEGSMHD